MLSTFAFTTSHLIRLPIDSSTQVFHLHEDIFHTCKIDAANIKAANIHAANINVANKNVTNINAANKWRENQNHCTPPPAAAGSGLQGPHPRIAFSTALGI